MGIDQPSADDASQSSQRRIGLTGGIASGKSSVARLLSERHGVPVLDADAYAREALAPGSAAAHAVVHHFGVGVLAPGSDPNRAVIDRTALARIVFTDASERRWLEDVVHPLVRARFAAELARLRTEPIVVLMIPLLFEAGLEPLCSEIWLVDCEQDQQLERLMARNALSEEDARARLGAQWPLAHKRPLASLVLDNRGRPEALAEQVSRALSP